MLIPAYTIVSTITKFRDVQVDAISKGIPFRRFAFEYSFFLQFCLFLLIKIKKDF